MKFELSIWERAYFANLLRVRAQGLEELMEERTMSGTKQELRDEIVWCRQQAYKLDDAYEPPCVSSIIFSIVSSGSGNANP